MGKSSAVDNGKKRRWRKNNCFNGSSMPPINLLEEKILQAVIGQDEPVRKILTAFYRSRTFEEDRGSTLVIGPSGTGKTEIFRQIISQLKIPYVIADATKYTKEGYVGCNVEDLVYELIEKSNRDIKLAQRGVIIIDEIDKKAGTNALDKGGDVAGIEVLKSLLKLMEGSTIPVEGEFDMELGDVRVEEFDTTNITFIFLGAFVGIEEIIKNRRQGTLGFVNPKAALEQNYSNQILKDDIISYGLIPEFVGRISSIIKLNELTVKDMEDILKFSTISPVRKYVKELDRLRIAFKMERQLYEEIARVSYSVKTGARELATVMDSIMSEPLYEIFANHGKYRMCLLKKEILKDPKQFELS